MTEDDDRSLRARALLDAVGLDVLQGREVDTSAILAAHHDLEDLIAPQLRAFELFGIDLAATTSAARDVAGQPDRSFGPFVIEHVIGAGGMGTVYEATLRSTGRRVALKTLDSWRALDPRMLDRFEREARAAARLRHPGIVSVLDLGRWNGTPYIVMDLIDGRPLDKILSRLTDLGPTSLWTGARRDWAKLATECDDSLEAPDSWFALQYPAWVLRMAAAVGDALEHAREHGVVHRDVKPGNILIDRSGRPIVVDFGLAHDERATTITRTHEYLGTPCYSSPEQAQGLRVDHQADIYSLGATLYHLVTLARPYDGSTMEVREKVVKTEPSRPRTRNSSISRDLETVTLTAMAKDRNRRYRTAADFSADLRALIQDRPIKARSAPTLSRAMGFVRRHRRPVLSIAVVAIVGAALVFFLRDRTNGWRQWSRDIGGDGHWYRLTSPSLTWSEAEAEAVALGAHLVAIGSRQKNYWVLGSVALDENCWIGLHRDPTSKQWVWTNGEPYDFKSWLPGEPNNTLGDEPVVEMKGRAADSNRDLPGWGVGAWNDARPNWRQCGIIEFVGTSPP